MNTLNLTRETINKFNRRVELLQEKNYRKVLITNFVAGSVIIVACFTFLYKLHQPVNLDQELKYTTISKQYINKLIDMPRLSYDKLIVLQTSDNIKSYVAQPSSQLHSN